MLRYTANQSGTGHKLHFQPKHPAWAKLAAIDNKAIGDVESTLAGILENTFTKIEVHVGMAKRMVRYLAIEEALQEKIKNTLEHNNKSYDEWCAQTDKGKNSTSFSWP